MEEKSEARLPYERQWAGTSKLKAILALTHRSAVVVFSLTVFILAVLAERGLPDLGTLACLILGMIFAQSAIGISNEVSDYELDAVSKPWRAIPAGFISLGTAKLLAGIATALGLLFAAMISYPSMLLLALGVSMGVLYNIKLKRSILSWLPYAIAYPLIPIWVWLSLGKLEPSMLIIYPVSLPLTFAIHLCNQLRDFDEDAAMGIRSVSHYLGKNRAILLCFSLLIISPLVLLVLHTSDDDLTLTFILLTSISVHWIRIIPCVWEYKRHPNPSIFRNIFRRLKLTGPLMLITFFLLQMN